MTTFAWVLILASLLVIRSVVKGRVMNITEDLSDAFLAFVRGDTKELEEVLQRKGDNASPSWAGVDDIAAGAVGTGGAVAGGAGTVGDAIGGGLDELESRVNNLAVAAVLLGEKAKGYRWEATGPDYYDCSGLMWRACRFIGYKGGRFTTATIRNDKKSFKVISQPGMQGPGITAAGPNDIVLWPAGSGGLTGHMGVITGPDKFYSARSVSSGIGESKISTFRKTKPIYIRYVGKRAQVSNPFK